MEQVTEKNIPENFRKWYLKAFRENSDKVDVFAQYDRKLTISENKDMFIKNFDTMLDKEFVEEQQLKEAKAHKEKFKVEELNKIKEEEKKLVSEWKKSDYQDIDINSFDTPRHFIRMLCKGFTNSVILIGEGGTGKSYLTINEIKKDKKDFEYNNTYITPLELYKLLYYNKEKIIVFDDVKGLFDSEKCIAILKSALWETDGKRIVTMQTADRVLNDVPKIYEFKGQIIILANKINMKDTHINALVSRSNFFELSFSYKEKLRIMKEIIKKPYKNTDEKLRKKALDLVIKNTDIVTEDLNFRTLIKTYDLLLYDSNRAESLLKSTLKINPELKLVMELIDTGKSVSEQITEFSLKTGKARATFFRLKDKIKLMMK